MSFGHHKLDRDRMDNGPAPDVELAAAVGDFLAAWRSGLWGLRLSEHLSRLERALRAWRSQS